MMTYFDSSMDFNPSEVLVYLRKSRSDDPMLSVEEVLSKHEAMLDEWAEKHLRAKVPEENKFREIVSGETISDRPEIQALLKKVESPRYKAVLIVEVQRLSRGDLEDAGRLIKLLRYTNTIVITPQRPFDLSNDYDRDYFERELKRGNEFLEYTKRIMNNGRLLSVSQGNFIGNKPPYGYNKSWVMDGKRKCPTLTESKEQADVVRMFFDMYVNQDMGCASICHRLDELGIAAPIGEKWSPAALQPMLSNVHYIGKVRWNRRKTVTTVENSEIIKTRPIAQIDDQLIYDGRHEGIISEELFKAAQEKRGRNHRAKSNTKVRNPLASLLFCKCGRAMSLRTYKTKDGSERCAPRLICDGQVYCHTGSCLYSDIIERMCMVLEENIADFEVKLKNTNADTTALHNSMIKSLEKRLKDLHEKEIAQWEQQSHPDPAQRMPVDIFKVLNEKLIKEREEVQQALNNAYETAPRQIDYQEKIYTLTTALNALRDESVDAQTKNTLLKACIDRMEYSREAPQRIKNDEKRVSVNGRQVKPNPLKIGGNWQDTPIVLNVKLRM